MNDKKNNVLFEARTAQKLTQEQLAKMLGTTRQTVAQWETGRKHPDEETMKSLTEILKIDSNYSQKLQQETAIPSPSIFSRNHLFSLCCAFVGGIIVASLFFCLIFPALTKPITTHTSESANPSSWEWYQTPAENIAEKPYLEIEPLRKPVKLTHSTDKNRENEFYWTVGYSIQEINGKPFTITKIIDSRFNAKKEIMSTFENTAEFLSEGWETTHLSAYDFKRVVRNLPVNNEYIGIGIAIYVTDDTGAEMIFPCYIELSQEIEERLAYTTTAFENDIFENDGASLLVVEAVENPVPLIDIEEFAVGKGWIFTFVMKNQTEADIHIKELTEIFFRSDGKETIRETHPEERIAEWLPSLTIAPNSEMELGTRMDFQKTSYMGFCVFFEDAEGNEYESRVLFTLMQE